MVKRKFDQDFHDSLKTHRNLLIQSSFELSDKLANRLFWVSAGSVSISAFLLEKLNPPNEVMILFLSWTSFALTVFFALLGFIFSQAATQKAIKDTDKQIANQDKEIDNTNYWNIFSQLIVILSLFSAIVGTVLLLVFIYKNLIHG